MADFASESPADFIPESVADFARNQQSAVVVTVNVAIGISSQLNNRAHGYRAETRRPIRRMD